MTLETPIISFVSVATDRYLAFWESQIYSAKEHLDLNARIEFVILTDQVKRVEGLRKELFDDTNWKLQIGSVPHQDWPFPTLFKFKHIIDNSNLLSGETIWHLDADMLFAASNTHLDLVKASVGDEMVFVSHPGYYRLGGVKRVFLYLTIPFLLVKDLKCLINESGLGTWERNHLSLAFVEPHKRLNYVCGGSWGGMRETFLSFSDELSSRIDEDFNSGIIARFHDESQINWYRANRPCKVLNPAYCFEESYENLKGVKKKIIAVDKSGFSNWVR